MPFLSPRGSPPPASVGTRVGHGEVRVFKQSANHFVSNKLLFLLFQSSPAAPRRGLGEAGQPGPPPLPPGKTLGAPTPQLRPLASRVAGALPAACFFQQC